MYAQKTEPETPGIFIKKAIWANARKQVPGTGTGTGKLGR
jgi:hypothetical protein